MASIMRMFLDIFAQIFRTLWAHKLRSFLTMFGIAWGVGSLLLLVGLGEGFRSGNRRQLEEFGKDIMFIFPGRAPTMLGSMNSARSYLLTYQDYLDIRKEAPHVRNASPVISREDVRAVSEFANANGEIVGTEPQMKRDQLSSHQARSMAERTGRKPASQRHRPGIPAEQEPLSRAPRRGLVRVAQWTSLRSHWHD